MIARIVRSIGLPASSATAGVSLIAASRRLRSREASAGRPGQLRLNQVAVNWVICWRFKSWSISVVNPARSNTARS
jgi:hypothetical protein